MIFIIQVNKTRVLLDSNYFFNIASYFFIFRNAAFSSSMYEEIPQDIPDEEIGKRCYNPQSNKPDIPL